MKILNKENILSIPVISEKETRFLGFVDVLDIASSVYHEWLKVSSELNGDLFPDEKYFETPISELLNYSRIDYPYFVSTTDTIEKVIQLFRSPRVAHRLHRVAVLDENKKMVDVLSQSDIIRFAAANITKFKSKKSKIAEELKIIRAPIMLKVDCSIADALLCVCNNMISGIALVDEQFQLIGNFSASDLRGIDPSCFTFFSGSVLQFLSKQSTPKPTKFMKEQSTLEEIVKEIASDNIHRIFVTSDAGFPKGVISLIDIITIL
uniref:CBS domain-containing protein n=1 Tax=Arcella intermedia TaxID=1963864 RepID=A0A6B2LCU7_9EUKA